MVGGCSEIDIGFEIWVVANINPEFRIYVNGSLRKMCKYFSEILLVLKTIRYPSVLFFNKFLTINWRKSAFIKTTFTNEMLDRITGWWVRIHKSLYLSTQKLLFTLPDDLQECLNSLKDSFESVNTQDYLRFYFLTNFKTYSFRKYKKQNEI